MALNTHSPYDDDDDFEEEWEVLNTDTTTAGVEEVAEHFFTTYRHCEHCRP